MLKAVFLALLIGTICLASTKLLSTQTCNCQCQCDDSPADDDDLDSDYS